MTPSIRRYAVLLTLATALVPSGAPAVPRAHPEPAADPLPPQDREMLALAQDFARRCAEKLEGWIAKEEISRERLFGALYYPVARTDPPKFTTDWDQLSDRDIQAVEEAVKGAFRPEAEQARFEEATRLKPPRIVFAVLVDLNGYLPTHNLEFSKPLTGNPEVDLTNNRTKRIFNDRTGLAAARSEAPYLFQRYQRDTGETMVDLSVPVMVGGAHWGAVRIGYGAVEGK